jgi:DNA-binding transcriptional LysR family regulator
VSVTFRQLEVFVEAAKDCNFRKTADRLGISQPSVSSQIRVLEQWAGCEVFRRSRGSTPRLTADGTALLRRAQTLLAGKRALSKEEAPGSKSRTVRLRVAAGPYILERYIRPALSGFLQTHKQFVLDFLPPAAAKEMRNTVRSGEADVAIYTGSRSEQKVAGAELICNTPCSIYGNTRHARFAGAEPSALSMLPFILPMEASGYELWMLRTLRKAGVIPSNVIARSQFADVMCGMVLAGKGVSVLFDEHMLEHVRAGRAFRLGRALESGSRVLLVGPRARSRAAAPFVGFLRQVLKSGVETRT